MLGLGAAARLANWCGRRRRPLEMPQRNEGKMTRSDVLLIGAGPRAWVPAPGLGVKERIVNKTAEPAATSRALGGPSWEHSNSTDSLTSPITVVAHGHKVPAVS